MFVICSNQTREVFSKGDAVGGQNSWEDKELEIMKWNLYIATLKIKVSLTKQQCLWKVGPVIGCIGWWGIELWKYI